MFLQSFELFLRREFDKLNCCNNVSFHKDFIIMENEVEIKYLFRFCGDETSSMFIYSFVENTFVHFDNKTNHVSLLFNLK